MFKLTLTTEVLLASWAISVHCAAQTFDANAAFKLNELGGGETTPSFGPFSVGYAENFGDFNPFTSAEHTNAFAGNANTQGFLTLNNVSVPAAVVNVSPSPFSGFSGLDAGEILLHPGGRGPNGFEAPVFDGVLRFTAPSTGRYIVTGSFRSLDSGVTQNTILHNTSVLKTISDAGSFNMTVLLQAGDRVDFSVGDFDGIGSDSTGLRATLSTAVQQIVNIDFNGKRPGDADSAGTFAGAGSAGGGTIFNGIAADSTGGNDNLIVSGSNLLSDTGLVTTVGFTISPVGGDHEPGQGSAPASLYDDYIFNNSAGNNTPGGSPFSISGLNDAIIADLYFYGSFGSQAFTVNGAPSSGVFGIYNGLEATAFFDVPVTAGEITGLFGVGTTGVLGGLSISSYSVIPEPASPGLALLGAAALLLRRRRHS